MSGFHNDTLFSATQKAEILADWRQFITHGFRQADFSQPLYQFLVQRCGFIAHFDREQFWRFFFLTADLDLIRFIDQFGTAEKRAAEGFAGEWLTDISIDLGNAFCQEMESIHDILRQTLDQFALEQYRRERERELAAMLAEAKATYPDHSEAELQVQLTQLYDTIRPLEEYDAAFILTEDHRRRLTQALQPPLDDTRHPTVFDLRQWLDQGQVANAELRMPKDGTQVVDKNPMRNSDDVVSQSSLSQAELSDIQERLSVGGKHDRHLDQAEVDRRQRLQDPEQQRLTETMSQANQMGASNES
ncbi:MAG: hypothetical protein AAF629_00235 [Chloroflexota bacterium]